MTDSLALTGPASVQRPTLADLLGAHPDFEEDVADTFVGAYVEYRAREAADADGADARARDLARRDTYEHEAFNGIDDTDDLPELPDDLLVGWLAAVDNLLFQIAVQRLEYATEDKLDAFAEMRAAGKTAVQIARKLGTDPGELLQLAGRKLDPQQRERLDAARCARREDDAVRAFQSRRRLLSSVAGRLTKELETRDLSDVPTDKLVTMLLRVSELSREDPPDVPVQAQYHRL